MSGAETARRRVVQRQIGGVESAAPKWPSPQKSSGTIYDRQCYLWRCFVMREISKMNQSAVGILKIAYKLQPIKTTARMNAT